MIAALDGNFLNHPGHRYFQQVVDLIPRAEGVDKLTAVCKACLVNNPSQAPAEAAFYGKIPL